MTSLFTVYFFVLGLCFGSFALATAWRIKRKKNFVTEHSECESCRQKLAAVDLIPLVSWLRTGGRCRYCKHKLSRLLPVAELTGGIFFALSYYAWPYEFGSALSYAKFIVWCVALVLLLILFFYDLQWYLLPNKVMYPLWWVSALYALIGFMQDPSLGAVISVALAVGVASGLFMLFYVVSKGTWIGFGDVRLGLAMGLILGSPLVAALSLFVASVAGIFFALPGLLTGNRKLTSKVPFGPLLIIGLVVSLLYGQSLIDWYTASVLLL